MGFLLGMYCIFLCLFLLYAMVLDKIEARKYARYTKWMKIPNHPGCRTNKRTSLPAWFSVLVVCLRGMFSDNALFQNIYYFRLDSPDGLYLHPFLFLQGYLADSIWVKRCGAHVEYNHKHHWILQTQNSRIPRCCCRSITGWCVCVVSWRCTQRLSARTEDQRIFRCCKTVDGYWQRVRWCK